MKNDEPVDLFSERVNALLASMKATHALLESFRALSQDLCEVRQKLEEDNGACSCVSDALYELVDATDAIRHIIAMYGSMVNNAASRVVNHDEERELAEAVVKKAKAAIQAVFSQREKPKEESKLN